MQTKSAVPEQVNNSGLPTKTTFLQAHRHAILLPAELRFVLENMRF